MLLRAFARLERPDARLIILGEGPERPRIEAEIAALGLRDRVDLKGYVEAPWDYYARARCFALASDSESFGLVVAEALAFGLPVVTTDCGGPGEILDDGRYGLLVGVGDEAAMTQALAKALDAPGDPGPRIARARNFSVKSALDNYAALFDEIAPA